MSKKKILSIKIDGTKKKQSFKSKKEDDPQWEAKVNHTETGIYNVKLKIDEKHKP